MKIYIYIQNALIILICLLIVGCSDVLDKSDLSAINEENVWSDETLTEGFLNEIYQRTLSGWPIDASSLTSDAPTIAGQNQIIYGELGSNSRRGYSGVFRSIRDINLLLEKIETGTLDADIKNVIVAQAQFSRAKLYFDLVSTYGGVPLVLKVLEQGIDDFELPRNKTSECIVQIITDLDNAIAGLPDSYDAANYGRITKGAAMAYKARVLLFYASEQFDPTQSASGRWQRAYDAIIAAKANLEANGKGLHPSYEELWFDESNSNVEAIIVRKYNSENTHPRDAGCRPHVSGTSGEAWDRPTIDLVDAYPMKDGKAITDPTSAYTYDSDVLWLNRDPRFAASIAYNGSIWPLKDPEPNRTSDFLWSFQESRIEASSDFRITATSFYCRKAIDGNIDGGGPALQSTTGWIELRFAEVLLYLAEAANEIGNTTEAYDALKAIRIRAGIDPGTGSGYGLQAGMDQDQMRDAIFLERRLELVFEGKRSSDLRRRRMYNTINNTHRKGYYIEKTAAFDNLDPSDQILDDRKILEARASDGTIDLDDPTVYNTYFTTQVQSLERDGNLIDDGLAINYLDLYYFFDLPQSALDKNPSLEQTQGWPGGTFDPLQ